MSTVMNVRVRGKRVHVHRTGSGQPLLLLTGWGTAACHYRRTLKLLGTRYECFCPSWPGSYGSTRLDKPWSLEDYEQWTLELIRSLPVQTPCTIIGHSFGGAVAARVAASHPGLILHLILVNPIGIPISRRIRQWGRLMFSMLMHETFVEGKARALIVFWHMGRHHLHSLLGRHTLWRTITQCMQEDLTETFRAIHVPTTIVCAGTDRLIPASVPHRIKELISRARWIDIPDAGHDVCCLEPDRFVEALLRAEWLANPERLP